MAQDTRTSLPRLLSVSTVRRARHLGAITLLLLLSWIPSSDALAQILKPSPLSDEAYGESFTAVADLSDGTYVLLQYVFTNAGFGDQKAACRGLVVRPGQFGVNSAVRVDRDEWSFDAASNALRVDKCVLSSAGARTEFRVKTKEVTVELTVKAGLKKIKPPKNKIKVGGGEFYEAEVLIPFAPVTAKVTTKAGSARLDGMGYLDHTRSNTRLPKIASRWLRFRGFQGAKPTLLEIRYDPNGKASGWQLLRGDVKPTAMTLANVDLEATKESVSFSVPLGQVKTSAVIYRYRPAKEWGLLGRLAKPWVGDPETRTFRASLTLPSGETITGILEQSLISSN